MGEITPGNDIFMADLADFCSAATLVNMTFVFVVGKFDITEPALFWLESAQFLVLIQYFFLEFNRTKFTFYFNMFLQMFLLHSLIVKLRANYTLHPIPPAICLMKMYFRSIRHFTTTKRYFESEGKDQCEQGDFSISILISKNLCIL